MVYYADRNRTFEEFYKDIHKYDHSVETAPVKEKKPNFSKTIKKRNKK